MTRKSTVIFKRDGAGTLEKVGERKRLRDVPKRPGNVLQGVQAGAFSLWRTPFFLYRAIIRP